MAVSREGGWILIGALFNPVEVWRKGGGKQAAVSAKSYADVAASLTANSEAFRRPLQRQQVRPSPTPYPYPYWDGRMILRTVLSMLRVLYLHEATPSCALCAVVPLFFFFPGTCAYGLGSAALGSGKGGRVGVKSRGGRLARTDGTRLSFVLIVLICFLSCRGFARAL